MPRRLPGWILAPALAVLLAGCGRRADDPALLGLAGVLAPGDRVVLLRVLGGGEGVDPAERIAAAVRPAGHREELRIYEKRGKEYTLVHTTQQGDLFRNLTLEDVTADGRPELLATWEGGQLEILQVITREEGGTYRTIFQNAGQEIEKRFGPGGSVEFWITGRTYEEGPGQPAIYASTVYRWDGKAFTEVRR